MLYYGSGIGLYYGSSNRIFGHSFAEMSVQELYREQNLFWWVQMDKRRIFSHRIFGVLLPLLALFALNGCAGLDEALGLAKNAPDESQIVTHEPLQKPQLATLPTPGDGVDNTIVPEPVDVEEKIRAEIEAEKKRDGIPLGATPETVAVLKARKAEAADATPESRAVQNEEPSEQKSSDDKPWWKVW